YTVTQADLDNKGGGDGDIDNTATGDCAELDPISDSEDVPLVFNPAYTIDKTVVSVTGGSGGSADSAGDIINYQVVLTNTGNVTLTSITMADTLVTLGAPTSKSANEDNDLDVGESWTWTYSYTVTQADLDNKGGGDGDIDNTATGDCAELDPISDSEDVPLAFNPAVDIEKFVSVDGGVTWLDADSALGPYVLVGDSVKFKVIVTNTGNVTLGIGVVDTDFTFAGIVTSLAPGASDESDVFTTTAVIGQQWDEAVVTGTPLVGTPVTDSDRAYYFGAYPHTTMQTIAYVWETSDFGNVTLTIRDTNDGNVPLTGSHIHLYLTPGGEYTGSPYGHTGLPAFVAFSGDTGSDGIMSPGETWQWIIQVEIAVTTTFDVQGEGYFTPLDFLVAGPSEHASLTVQVNLATRTQGFWSTHLAFTTQIFNSMDTLPLDDTNVVIDLGYKQIRTIDELMGIFWANNAKNADGSKRDKLGQARETAAQQALAAILNSVMPGGKPLPAGYSLTDIKNVLGGTNQNAIKALGSALDAFNNSGDNVALPPGTVTGKADPNGARDIADIGFADT
ncbi:MAG: hypothetical protein AAGU24_00260, partial [Dehalogenimonas sp.]